MIDPQTGRPTSYTISISEEQRKALVALLVQSERDSSEPVQITGEEESLVYWINMLHDLPAVEHENPGILHGFCL
jgi:hypothetical protein